MGLRPELGHSLMRVREFNSICCSRQQRKLDEITRINEVSNFKGELKMTKEQILNARTKSELLFLSDHYNKYCYCCSYCHQCFDCIYCDNCYNCTNCSHCNDCKYCTNCSYCEYSQHQEGESYVVFNVKLTREEYQVWKAKPQQ